MNDLELLSYQPAMVIAMDHLNMAKQETQTKVQTEQIDEVNQVRTSQQQTPGRADEEKALVRRVDLVLMPALWVMYLFSYADRTK